MHGERLVVPIRGLRFVWRFAIVGQLTTRFSVWGTVANYWMYEHGFLLISLETVSKRAFHTHVRLQFENKWGYFTVYDVPNYLVPHPRTSFPVNTRPGSFVAMTLRNVKDTSSLRDDVLGLLNFLEEDDDAYTAVKAGRETMNKNIKQWIRQGWLHHTGCHHFGVRPKLRKNEVFNKKYGNEVLRRERPERLLEGIDTILNLSSGTSM